MVLLLPAAVKLFWTYAIPPEKFVSIKFTVLILTVVIVPATNKSEDKYMFAAVIVSEDNQEVATEENEPRVE